VPPAPGPTTTWVPSGMVSPIETGGRGGSLHQFPTATRSWAPAPAASSMSSPPPTGVSDATRTAPLPSMSAAPGGPSRVHASGPLFVTTTVPIREPAAPSQAVMAPASRSAPHVATPAADEVAALLGVAEADGAAGADAERGDGGADADGGAVTCGDPQAVRRSAAARERIAATDPPRAWRGPSPSA
jgi:hypothetical protein